MKSGAPWSRPSDRHQRRSHPEEEGEREERLVQRLRVSHLHLRQVRLRQRQGAQPAGTFVLIKHTSLNGSHRLLEVIVGLELS